MVSRTKLLGRCAELEAAYLDVLNSMHGIVLSSSVDIRDSDAKPQDVITRSERTPPSALLRISEYVRTLRRASAAGDITILEELLVQLAASDVDTANHVLEIVPQLWDVEESPGSAHRLCNCYIRICTATDAPDLRAAALTNLASLLDALLENSEDGMLPETETVLHLWNTLQQGDINPTLSHAILRVSGPLMATVVRQSTEMAPEHILRSWAHTVSSASDAENVCSSETRPPSPIPKRHGA